MGFIQASCRLRSVYTRTLCILPALEPSHWSIQQSASPIGQHNLLQQPIEGCDWSTQSWNAAALETTVDDAVGWQAKGLGIVPDLKPANTPRWDGETRFLGDVSKVLSGQSIIDPDTGNFYKHCRCDRWHWHWFVSHSSKMSIAKPADHFTLVHFLDLICAHFPSYAQLRKTSLIVFRCPKWQQRRTRQWTGTQGRRQQASLEVKEGARGNQIWVRVDPKMSQMRKIGQKASQTAASWKTASAAPNLPVTPPTGSTCSTCSTCNTGSTASTGSTGSTGNTGTGFH